MKFKRGTPTFGIVLGIIFMAAGLLWIRFGFWKTVLLLALFAVGYFIGAVDNKTQMLKDTVNRIVPDKKPVPIDVRETVTREQENAFRTGKKAEEAEEEE